jgi:hypothetical protein
VGTFQEFNLEKMNLLQSEKQRIGKEYERKESQVEANKKMCVALHVLSCLSITNMNYALSAGQADPWAVDDETERAVQSGF